MRNGTTLPPAYLFASLASMVLMHLFIPVYQLIPYPWNATGLIPLAAGIVLNLSAGRAFKENNTTLKPYEESTVLITSGTFKYSRNPMYLGMVLILTGVALLQGSLSTFIIIPIFAISMDRTFILTEEKMLDQRFGEQWKDYKKTARRWI